MGVIAIGGDGTILSTSRRMCGSEKPIFGIHIGGLGFLAQIMSNNITNSIEMLSNNSYTIEERNLIEVCINNNSNIEYDTNTIFNQTVDDYRNNNCHKSRNKKIVQ